MMIPKLAKLKKREEGWGWEGAEGLAANETMPQGRSKRIKGGSNDPST